METRRIEYFLVLAQERNFTRAADALDISQPALSQQIAKLERELGARLIDRSTQPVELTPYGKQLVLRGQGILEDLSVLREEALGVRRGTAGRLRLGVTPSLLFSRMPRIIRSFMRARPNVSIRFYRENTRDLTEMLGEGRVDAILTFTRPEGERIEWRQLYPDQYVVALPEDHPLAENAVVRLRQLRDEPMLMFERGPTPENYDGLIAACARAGFVPKEVMIRDAGFVDRVGLVNTGLGIGLIPGQLAWIDFPGVTYRRLVEPSVDITTTIAWSTHQRSPLTDAFVRYCLKHVEMAPDAVHSAGQPQRPARGHGAL